MLKAFRKGRQIIAMKYIAPNRLREALPSLRKPVDGRMTSNDKYMLCGNRNNRRRHHLVNDREHRTSFAGLSECDSKNGVCHPVQELLINVVAELNLIREQLVEVL